MHERPSGCALVLALAGLAAACVSCAAPRTGLTFHQLDYALPTKFVTVAGIDVAYTEAGAGEPTILFVHGLGSNLLVWQKTIDALSARHRVVAIDLPGYGRSAKRNYDYSMRFFAGVVDRVIDALALDRPVIVGHSMGGQIALTHALHHPGRARALVLAAPAGFETFGAGEGQWLMEAVSKDFIKATPPDAIYTNLASNFTGDVPKDALFMYQHRVQIVDGPEFDAYAYANARSVQAMLKGPVYDRLGEVRLPVLVVFGAEDRLIPNQVLHGGTTRRVAEQGTRRLKRARLVMLAKAGHMLQVERPEAFNRAVRTFLDEEVRP